MSLPAKPELRRHLDGLDGMRALAAYGVLATHAGFNSGRSLDDSPFAPFLARLDFGVTVFFLLSGFLLYRPFALAAFGEHPAPAIGRFYLRRALRILPPYWLAVLVTLLLLSTRPASLADFASYLTLTQTYNHHNLDPSLTQMWTLAVEISFYALLPMLAAAARGRRRRCDRATLVRQLALLAIMVLIAVGADVFAHRSTGDQRSLLWLPANLDWFAAGMLLAVLSAAPVGVARAMSARLHAWAQAPGTCWIIALLLFWLATLPLAGPRNLIPPSGWAWTIKHWLYTGAALALLVPLVFSPGGAIGRFLGSRPVRLLGELSYGVYLWHLGLLLAIQRWLGQRTFGGHFLELFGLAGLSATAVAAATWFGFERRLLSLGRRSTPPATTAVPSTASPASN
ncbi:MAG TPA: acyltransferase [Jatrophihabitans sp.]|nr:acyltransferase [Jatrophihabitans sp.]